MSKYEKHGPVSANPLFSAEVEEAVRRAESLVRHGDEESEDEALEILNDALLDFIGNEMYVCGFGYLQRQDGLPASDPQIITILGNLAGVLTGTAVYPAQATLVFKLSNPDIKGNTEAIMTYDQILSTEQTGEIYFDEDIDIFSLKYLASLACDAQNHMEENWQTDIDLRADEFRAVIKDGFTRYIEGRFFDMSANKYYAVSDNAPFDEYLCLVEQEEKEFEDKVVVSGLLSGVVLLEEIIPGHKPDSESLCFHLRNLEKGVSYYIPFSRLCHTPYSDISDDTNDDLE